MSMQTASEGKKIVNWALDTLQKKLVWVFLLLSISHNIWSEIKLNRASRALIDSQKYIQTYSENRRREDEDDKKAWRESYFIMSQIIPYFNNEKKPKDSIIFSNSSQLGSN